MKSSYLTNLVLILLVIGLYWFNNQEQSTINEVSHLTTLTSNDIKTITITRPNADTIVLKKSPSAIDWQLTQPFLAKANTTRVDLLLGLLHAPSYAQQHTGNDLALSSFGLKPANVIVNFDDHEFKFGSVETISKHRYVLHNDTIHLITDQINPLLNTRAASFIDNKLIPDNIDITKISLPLRHTDNSLSNDHAVIENRNGHWQSAFEIGNSDQLTKLITAWQHAYALQVLPLQSKSAIPASSYQIQIWYQGQEQPLKLTLQLNDNALFIINHELQLKYQFPTAILQQLFPAKLAAS